MRRQQSRGQSRITKTRIFERAPFGYRMAMAMSFKTESHPAKSALPLQSVAARLRASQPFLTESVIPGGSYRGVGDVVSLSVGIAWITSAAADETVVHGLTRALWHPNNRRVLDANATYGRHLRPEAAVDGLGFPLHRGAALAYAEIGALR